MVGPFTGKFGEFYDSLSQENKSLISSLLVGRASANKLSVGIENATGIFISATTIKEQRSLLMNYLDAFDDED